MLISKLFNLDRLECESSQMGEQEWLKFCLGINAESIFEHVEDDWRRIGI